MFEQLALVLLGASLLAGSALPGAANGSVVTIGIATFAWGVVGAVQRIRRRMWFPDARVLP